MASPVFAQISFYHRIYGPAYDEGKEQQRTLLSIGHSYGQQNRHINKKPRVLSLTFGFRADGVVAIATIIIFVIEITPLWAFRIAT